MTDETPAGLLSHVRGSRDTPLIRATIGTALESAAHRWADRQALVVCHQAVRLNWQQLDEVATRCAAGFLSLGLEPGDRVGIWAPNCLEWVLTQFATARAGLILVNINPAFRLHELEFVLNKVGCKALVTAARFKNSDYLAMLMDIAPELGQCRPGALHAKRLPALRMVIRLGDEVTSGMMNFSALQDSGGARERDRLGILSGTLQPDDPINIQFTSGTTGSPKGATLTHTNILNNGFFVGEAMRFTESDRLCIPVPFYHCFGMVMGNLNCVTHGTTMVIPSEGFDAELTLQAIDREKCTAVYGVPTMFIAELDHPSFSRYDLRSLRTGIMAGAPCPVEVMRRVVRDMHLAEITIAYGMTETSPVSFQSEPDDPIERRVTTVGRIQPHLEVKVTDQAGRVLPRGERGELHTRGYSVMRGYWGEEERTAAVLSPDGWMRTGDLGVIDEEGYCTIVGRVKDMVIRGGENISPREVEEFLFGHDKIQDVSVFGVPDYKYGEELCAWVRLKDGATADEEEIRQFCREKIAHYKVPRYIRFVREFPLTATGKIQKFVMRERMIEQLGNSGDSIPNSETPPVPGLERKMN